MIQPNTARKIEILGVLIIFVSLLLPWTRMDTVIGSNVSMHDVNLLDFIINSALGVKIAAIILGIGILGVILAIFGYILVWIGSVSLLLITINEYMILEASYRDSYLGIGVLVLILGVFLSTLNLYGNPLSEVLFGKGVIAESGPRIMD